MKRAAFAARIVALAAVAWSGTQAQEAPRARRQFEVASIKPADSARQPSPGNPLQYSPGGRFTATNVTLTDVIVQVYPTRRVQMRGGPDWIDSDRFDLVAKAGAAGVEVRPEEWAPMVQALLEDRFHLAFHYETREIPVTALLPGKKTSNLLQPKAADEPGVKMEQGKLLFTAMTMAELCDNLSDRLHLPVLDRTGIAGRFNFTLDPYSYMQTVDPATPVRTEVIGDLLLAAVREKLGFKLEKQKARLDIMVVDRAERPAGN